MSKVKLCGILSVVALVVVLTVITMLSEDEKQYTVIENTNANTFNTNKNDTIKFTGIIKSVDTEMKIFVIRSIDSGIDMEYMYKGSTSIRNKYEKELSAGQVKKGDIFEIKYKIETSDRIISFMQMSSDMWEYEDIKKFNIQGKEVTVGDETLQLAFNMLVSDGEDILSKNVLSKEDIVDIKGINDNVYFILIKEKHSTLLFENYENYIGGMLTIDYDNSTDIKKDLTIDCKKGKHTLIMTKDNSKATIEVMVKNSEEYTVDMSKSDVDIQQYSNVTFEIIPDTARVYIDGRLCDKSNETVVTYGKHTINIELSGYNSYVTLIDVNTKEMVIKAELTKEENKDIIDDTKENKTKEDIQTDEDEIDKEEIEEDTEEEIEEETEEKIEEE